MKTKKVNKNKNKIAWIIIIIILSLTAVIGTYQYIQKYLENKLQEYYESKAEEFLKDKYSREFEIEFYEKGKETLNLGKSIGANCNCYCLETDIDEYRFKYYPEENKDIVGCVGVRVDPEDDPYNIKEIVDLEYEYRDESFFEPYKENVKDMEIKEELLSELKNILSSNYRFDIVSDARGIEISTDLNLHDLIINDDGRYKKMLNEIKEISDSQERITIRISYKECTSQNEGKNDLINFKSGSTIDKIYEDEYLVEDLKKIVKDMDDVTFFPNDKDIIIEKSELINKQNEKNFLENLKEIAKKYRRNITVKYGEYKIEIDKYGEMEKNT